MRRGEMTVSLKTGRAKQAARAAREIKSGMDRIMSAIEQGLASDLIEEHVRAWVARSASCDDERLALSDGLTGVLTADEVAAMGRARAGELDALFKMVAIDRTTALRTKVSRAVSGIEDDDDTIKQMLDEATRGVALPISGPNDAKIFRRSVLRNMTAYLDSTHASLMGLPIPDRIVSWRKTYNVEAVTPTEAPLANADVNMSFLWEQFTTSKVEDEAWKKGEMVSARSTLRLWIQITGDRTVSSYTSIDVEKFRRVYKTLPSDYYHNKKWKRIYEENGALVLSEKSKHCACERTSSKTFNKHLARLSEFWSWASGTKGLALAANTPSICKGFFIKIKKVKTNAAVVSSMRRRYTDAELQRIFSAPTYTGSQSKRAWRKRGLRVFRDHRYWLPLIGVLHGMRREEPIILDVKHVRRICNIWYFDLTDSKLLPLLKDIGSPRLVPIHRSLIDLGFIEARVTGRPPDARLFPEAFSYSEIGRHGQPFGQWYLAFRKFSQVEDDETDFHALRHNFINRLLDVGVPRSHAEELAGHESTERRSELSTYDHGRLVGVLKEAIDRLIVPIDVPILIEAVFNSDRIDPLFAWPSLDDGTAAPRPKKGFTPKSQRPNSGGMLHKSA